MILDFYQIPPVDYKSDGTLEISYYNELGKVEVKSFNFPFKNWVACKDNEKGKSTKFKNWNGESVKLQSTKQLNKFTIYEFLWKLEKEDQDKILALNYPKIASIDIETHVPDEGVPNFKEWVQKAHTPVNTIAITLDNNTIIVLGVKDLSNEEKNSIQDKINLEVKHLNETFTFKYKKFENEKAMLYTFLVDMVPKFGVQIGWNYKEFDWNYIANRAVKTYNIDLGKCSPTGEYNGKTMIPYHVGIIDFAEIFAKWDRSIDVKENNTLDFVAGEILKVKKIKYNGSLNDLYKDDFPKYVLYNAIDSVLVLLINKKTKLMNLLCTLSKLCSISIYKATQPTTIGESLLSRGFFEESKVVAYKYEDIEKVKFEGAYVKVPIVGFHEWVACFDFASLYPTIMRMFNISPESYLGCIREVFMKDGKEDVEYNLTYQKYESLVNNQTHMDKIKNKRQDKTKIVTVSGSVYDTKESVLRKQLTTLYNQRVEFKAVYKKALMEIDRIEKEIKNV